MYTLELKQVKSKIHPLYHDLLQKDSFVVDYVKAQDLLTPNRFDLAAKLLFIDGLTPKPSHFLDAYTDHIRAFSLGSYTEPGNSDKNTIEKFISTFEKLYSDIRRYGFDESKSIIPCAGDGTILDGAHRVACAISLGRQVPCIRFDCSPARYDYDFFCRRAMSASHLDACATKFVECSRRTYMALVWPAAKGKNIELLDIIPNIIFQRTVSLTANGLHNLMSIVYQDEPWLGSRSRNFPGINNKAALCYSEGNPLRVFLFQADSLQAVTTIKSKIRELFNIDKHSVHINDTHRDSVELARTLFNDNALNFLNFAKPNYYTSTFNKINTFRNKCIASDVKLEKVVLDAGVVVSLYGLRECDDIDFISEGPITFGSVADKINNHSETLVYHEKSASDLINDPCNFFYYRGIKFICLGQIYRMKMNRAETKDKNDIELIRSMLKKSRLGFFLASFRQKVFYLHVKIKSKVVYLLRLSGLYRFIMPVYRRFFK